MTKKKTRRSFGKKYQPSGYLCFPKQERQRIAEIIATAIASESVNDLRVYHDLALAQLLQEAGHDVNENDVAYYRKAVVKAPGASIRTRLLLQQRELIGAK